MRALQQIKLTRSQLRLLILAGVMTAYFVLFLFFLLIPFQIKVHSLEAQVKTFFEESEKAQGMMLDASRSGETFEMVLGKLEKYRQMAPTPDKVAEVLNQAASNAERYRLRLLSMKPRNEEKIRTLSGKPFVEEGHEARLLKVEASLSGSFFSLGNYLIALENAPYKIILKDLEIRNPQGDTKGSGASDLDIRIDVGVLTMRPVE